MSESRIKEGLAEFCKKTGMALDEFADTIDEIKPGAIVNIHIGIAVGDEEDENVISFVTAGGSKRAIESMLIHLLRDVHVSPLICDCGCEQFELREEEEVTDALEVSEKGIVIKSKKHDGEEGGIGERNEPEE